MKIVFAVGLLLVVLGIASLFVPIPHKETHGVRAGDFSIAVETRNNEKVSPVVSALVIGVGVVMIVAGSRGRK